MNFYDSLFVKFKEKGAWKKVAFIDDLLEHTTRTDNPHQVLVRQTLVEPPASSTSPGQKGDIAIDENYIYVCVAENLWKRVPLETW